MSSRVLRKLQGENELPDEVSDNETDLGVSGGARRKQLNINRYDLVKKQTQFDRNLSAIDSF